MFIIEGHDPSANTWFYMNEFENETEASTYVKKLIENDRSDPFLTVETQPTYYVRKRPSELFCFYPDAEMRRLYKSLAV